MNTEKKAINPGPAERPGIKTSEFWVVLLVNLLVAAMTYFEQVPGALGIIIIGGLTFAYNTLRASIKNKLLSSK